MKSSPVVEAEVLKNYVDILYLKAFEGQMPPEIRQLLKQKKMSFVVLPVAEFHLVLHRLDMVGTVIIDTEGLELSQQQKLARIIELLEAKLIGIILLNGRIELPVKSFSLVGPPLRSFVLTTTMESVSIDELWFRISVNLAYRHKSSGIVVKPAAPPERIQGLHNQLAEQLIITGEMVDNLAEQLRMAGLVQRDFLPSQLPNTEKFQWAATFLPAEWVSGDIYDIVRIDERHIGFYVADAVGHSMPAALLTIFVKQALVMRETVANSYRIFSPSEVMRNLNVRMAAQKLSGYQFATCCYCLLNTDTLQLTFARAGHPYPVLIRPGQKPQQLEVRGSLLGIFEQAEYVQQTIQLQRGDKLLVYSDGAEPLIGSVENLTGFNFSQDFDQMKDLTIAEMFDRLDTLAQNKPILPSEIDDITAVGLEIK